VDLRTGAKCLGFLLDASPEFRPGSKAEDFHQQLEQDAVDALGVEVAGYVNYGKSRNDQVATAIRMELRLVTVGLLKAVSALQDALLSLSNRHGGDLLPGYTHLQRAQPVTLAHHFFAHFDALERDEERLFQLYRRVNLSPMGSAAMAGTSASLDRREIASNLGFDGIVANALDGVSSRDILVEALSCATLIMLDAARLAEELILWSSSEFGFVELADAYSASSSIMPQKKNPVVPEIVRAKAGSVLGALVAVCTIVKALPFSYNLDLQETTPHLWRAMDDTTSSLMVLAGAISTLTVKSDSVLRAVEGDNSTAVALANHLVKEFGVSFREAHALVGKMVKASLAEGVPLSTVASRPGAMVTRGGKKLRLEESTAERILDPRSFLSAITTEGGSNPSFIAPGLKSRQAALSKDTRTASRLSRSLEAHARKLRTKASRIVTEVKTRS